MEHTVHQLEISQAAWDIGFLEPILYSVASIAGGTGWPADFHKITWKWALAQCSLNAGIAGGYLHILSGNSFLLAMAYDKEVCLRVSNDESNACT